MKGELEIDIDMDECGADSPASLDPESETWFASAPSRPPRAPSVRPRMASSPESYPPPPPLGDGVADCWFL